MISFSCRLHSGQDYLAFTFHFRISGLASSPRHSPLILLRSARSSKAGCHCHHLNSHHLENFPIDDFWYLVLASSFCVRTFWARPWNQFLCLSVVTDLGSGFWGAHHMAMNSVFSYFPLQLNSFLGFSVLQSCIPWRVLSDILQIKSWGY